MRNSIVLAAIAVALAVVALPKELEPEVRAGTALRMGVPDLVAGSDLVVEARVLEARAEEVDGGLIETIYTLAADRVFWGDGYAGEVREVRIPGGVLPDGRGMLLSGVSRLDVGEDALLFLSEEGPRSLRMPVGLAQGRYRVETRLDGTRVVTRSGGGIGLVNATTGELEDADGLYVRDYADFVAEVEAAVSVRMAGGDL